MHTQSATIGSIPAAGPEENIINTWSASRSCWDPMRNEGPLILIPPYRRVKRYNMVTLDRRSASSTHQHEVREDIIEYNVQRILEGASQLIRNLGQSVGENHIEYIAGVVN